MSGLIALGAAVAVITGIEQDLELVWLLPKQ